MPHRDPIYDIALPVGINKQYLLSLIPAFGFVTTVVTCLINIRKIKRSAAFSWWIQSFLPIVLYSLMLALIIWLCAVFISGALFVALVAVATYMVLVGMCFAMILVEKKLVLKLSAEAAQEKSIDEQEVK